MGQPVCHFIAAACLLAAACSLSLQARAQDATYVRVPVGVLVSVLAGDADRSAAPVDAFDMRVMPVTQDEFRAFVITHPLWRRGQAVRTFVDGGYLKDWATPEHPTVGATSARPVVNVSWFAAQAYCEAEGARLPTWQEWEYVAAADASRHDARDDPAWRARILNWYARPVAADLPTSVVRPTSTACVTCMA